MDREIPKAARQKARLLMTLKWGVGFVVGMGLVIWAIRMARPTLRAESLLFSTVDVGSIEIAVSATGRVVPAFEEIINSPIPSRIVETYKTSGDRVEAGEPLLKLDLQSAETDYQKQLDEERVRELRLEQLKIQNQARLSEMATQLKVSRMELNRKAVEVRNERYLDSLGAGTPDKVLQVELDYNVSRLRLEEDEQKYRNEQATAEADLRVEELELSIFRKSLAETRRTLDDAQIRSPRAAVLTYINDEIGARVAAGDRVAIVSDLSHLKIEGEIADAYGDRLAVGGKAIVRLGQEALAGTVSDVTPLSQNGVIAFTVRLDDDAHPRLRSGLRVDIDVATALKDSVCRVANGSYYVGPGEYELFVDRGGELMRQTVKLGESNYEQVEVVEGLRMGDRVVVSDMSEYRNKTRIKLK